MEQQYKTDAEIYAVLEREIIDLTIRPGSSLSENPLCARFGAPRSLIRVVLQKLQENGLVRIVPYKGTTVTRLNRRIVDELIYERTAVEGRILRDFAPNATPAQRAQIRARVDAYEALARAENPDFNKLYEMDCRLHETWFAAMDKMYLWSTLQNAHADYSRFRMLDTMTTGGLDEVIADHRNLLNAIERCDLAAFEPLVERHLYGGIRRPRRKPGLQQAVRDGLPPARNMVCRYGQDVPVEHLTECPRRLQPVPYAGHHDHRRAGRGDRRPPQPAERHRAVRPCRL